MPLVGKAPGGLRLSHRNFAFLCIISVSPLNDLATVTRPFNPHVVVPSVET